MHDSEASDSSTSSNGSLEYYSQAESHANASAGQMHGPSPNPTRTPPTASTPTVARRAPFVDAPESRSASSDAQRSSSGPFKKLSELRPSALRRSFSRPESANAAGNAATAAPKSVPARVEESSGDERSDIDSSDEDEQARQPVGHTTSIPLAKQAGSSAEVSASDKSREKRKRSFFSAFS